MSSGNLFFVSAAAVFAAAMFSGCAENDNPIDVPTPDKHYVLVKDSVVSDEDGFDGTYSLLEREYDAKGRCTRCTAKGVRMDELVEVVTYDYTYGDDVIKETMFRKNLRTNKYFSADYEFALNEQGLVKAYETNAIQVYYEYDNLGQISKRDNGSVVFYWKDGDLEKTVIDYGDGMPAYETCEYTDYTIDFPAMMPFLLTYNSDLSLAGYYGKATRHLISRRTRVTPPSELMPYTEKTTINYTYVIKDGRVAEFTQELKTILYDDTQTAEGYSTFGHHYLTWKAID